MAVRASTRRGALVMALALAAAGVVACGGGGEDDAASSATVDQDVKNRVEDQLAGSTGTTVEVADEPTSMEDWEALWADQRQAIVDRIKENGWGTSADGKSITGPEGYKVDLAACPAEWSETEGLTDTSIKFGWPAPLSGPQADFGALPKGAKAVLDHYSAAGAFKDSAGKTRSFDVIIRDDAYDTARTIPLTDEMLDSDRVFALATMISPGGLKTYDKVNQRCVPQYITTGHPAWGDPVSHPWTTGIILSYATEAILWGSFIEQHLDEWGGKAKVAALVMSNDFGKAYINSLKAFIEQSPRKADITLVTEGLEPAAPTIKDQMTTLASQSPDVYIAMVTGTSCTQSITESAENGMSDNIKAAFLPSVCKASSFIGKDKVGGDGAVSDGWWIVGGGTKDFNAAALANDPYIAWGRDVIKEAGFDYATSGNYGWGVGMGWQLAQIFMIAGDLPGGLTRANLNIATRTIDMTSPALISGVKYNMDGNADAYLIEGSDIAQWSTAEQQWKVDSVVELSGASKNCAWNAANGACA